VALAMLLAVLHRHGGIPCFDQDVFVNAVGGVKITEPGADLAVLLAIVSSLKNKPLPKKTIIFGEVGLAGEVRPVQRGQERLKEAAKLGFKSILISKFNKIDLNKIKIDIKYVEKIEDIISILF
jgi:DNA repair protein RadA/Sms